MRPTLWIAAVLLTVGVTAFAQIVSDLKLAEIIAARQIGFHL